MKWGPLWGWSARYVQSAWTRARAKRSVQNCYPSLLHVITCYYILLLLVVLLFLGEAFLNGNTLPDLKSTQDQRYTVHRKRATTYDWVQKKVKLYNIITSILFCFKKIIIWNTVGNTFSLGYECVNDFTGRRAEWKQRWLTFHDSVLFEFPP